MRIPPPGATEDAYLIDIWNEVHNREVIDRLGIPCCGIEMFFWRQEITPGHDLFHGRTRLGHHGEFAAEEVSRPSKRSLHWKKA
jgi:hypothetical protein